MGLKTHARSLLASDMDGTVIPPRRTRKRVGDILRFKRWVENSDSVILAYVTGRHLDLALAGIHKFRLPMPRILVCDVGTSIYIRRGRKWQVEDSYRRKMKQLLGGFSGDDIVQCLKGVSDLTLQEEVRQAEFKRSYYVPYKIDRKKLIHGLRRKLNDRGIKANLVYSIDSRKKVGLLDVLPNSAAKDFALHYLQKKLKLAAENVVYAGDSGNDLLAFLSGFNSIIVANTPKAVQEVLRKMEQKAKFAGRLFFASKRYTAGVLEGCEHFGFF